jgi:hypothetical protein
MTDAERELVPTHHAVMAMVTRHESIRLSERERDYFQTLHPLTCHVPPAALDCSACDHLTDPTLTSA